MKALAKAGCRQMRAKSSRVNAGNAVGLRIGTSQDDTGSVRPVPAASSRGEGTHRNPAIVKAIEAVPIIADHPSLKVWRSMPAASAASLRLMPESALAIAKRRRATRGLALGLGQLAQGRWSPIPSDAQRCHVALLINADRQSQSRPSAESQQRNGSHSFDTAV